MWSRPRTERNVCGLPGKLIRCLLHSTWSCPNATDGSSYFFFQAEDGIRDYWRDWSSDVCSSDLRAAVPKRAQILLDNKADRGSVAQFTDLEIGTMGANALGIVLNDLEFVFIGNLFDGGHVGARSEERRVGKECSLRGWPDQLTYK